MTATQRLAFIVGLVIGFLLIVTEAADPLPACASGWGWGR